MSHPFFSLHTHGFLRAAVCAPRVAIANPRANAAETLAMAKRAAEQGASLALFPELGLSAYAIDDLLQQDALLEAVETALADLLEASKNLNLILAVGAPLRHKARLYNCAVLMLRGTILGVAPKSYLPGYREFYEKRHFAPGVHVAGEEIDVAGVRAPFGADLVFVAEDFPNLAIHAEICEDLWTPIPPSARAAMAGASVLLNLSASNAIIGKSDVRQTLCASQSARCLSAYLYSAAGEGESTTDLAWDGEALIYELGVQLAKAERFAKEPPLVLADVDLGRIAAERLRQTSFGDCADAEAKTKRFREIRFALVAETKDWGFVREIPRFPFVPDDEARLSELCFEAFNIQAHGLVQRLRATGLKKLVMGVSGGLDSTQALLVAATATDRLGWPRENVLAYTLPAYATSARTRANAWALMRALGVSAQEIDVTPACQRMLEDIGHPAAKGEAVYDLTYENVQAGARTSLLFRLANRHEALVLGTGDLSELALGWCTYGVGDQMSHYNVNASVPKTLIQHLIRWCAREARYGAGTVAALHDILETEISPELVPSGAGAPQRTEDFVGPYALQDFNLFYATRYGFSPAKIAFLAYHAWRDAGAGRWPAGIAADKRVAYDLPDIKRWLGVFLRRFFQTSQFKRSALPNGPKVSSGGSLSPRGDWRAPSDSDATAWLADLERIP
ncbi:NAD(+) synthase [Methylocystis bryophila]|uniref:Glutamine-dependent NAD(+) synthetase n=1 Tax=Methylocystis bryophila TaxID=655015 RepID=A0A1W6MQU4_9HYPH|nr:NAD(+) synthase [Methylocystis bryophila]ARN79916.1 NAD(+) synthase [Methylocystis bryophila]